MKKRIYNVMQKLTQATYITTYIVLTMGIGGNIDTNRPITKGMLIIYGISTTLTLGKIWYCTRNEE